METLEAYPLAWPLGRPRTKTQNRQPARFYESSSKLTIYTSLERLQEQLRKLKSVNVVISTDVPTKRNGMPMSSFGEPADPGVAAYFAIGKDPTVHCLACDKWDRLADNIAAVAAHINAMRGQLRWGVGDLKQAFAGYKALTAVGEKYAWWTTLGFKKPPPTSDDVKTHWRELAAKHHPDKGGNQSQAADINAAWNEAQKYYEEQA